MKLKKKKKDGEKKHFWQFLRTKSCLSTGIATKSRGADKGTMLQRRQKANNFEEREPEKNDQTDNLRINLIKTFKKHQWHLICSYFLLLVIIQLPFRYMVGNSICTQRESNPGVQRFKKKTWLTKIAVYKLISDFTFMS